MYLGFVWINQEENSPFNFGQVVKQSQFTNRERETRLLLSHLMSGINVCLISPRRWGKSSLVQHVLRELKEKKKNYITVSLDGFAAASQEEFLEQFALACLKASTTKWEEWLNNGKDLLQSLIPTFSFGIDPSTDFSLKFDWKEGQANPADILNLPQRLAEKYNKAFIVCIDEFQNLAEFPEYEELEKKMRSVWQHHDRVSYCLYGSKRHMLSEIFNSQSKPFYRFGELILLDKISEDKWVNFLSKKFKETGKHITKKQGKQIASLVKNHPWYVQQLAHHLWHLTEVSVSDNAVKQAFFEVVKSQEPLFIRDVEYLSRTQVNTLKAIAKEENSLMGVQTMDTYDLGTPNNVRQNLDKLLHLELIERVNKQYLFLDPVFQRWFEYRFFGRIII